jgi:glutamine synthetase
MRETAFRHKVYATFMAKPMANLPGSALHLHQSLFDLQSKRNLFANEEGKHTPLFLSFIAGLQTYLPEMMPMIGPNVNSYRRIIPNTAAPINVHWGVDNRTVGLRVPFAEQADMRVENRLPGADANPYLAMAASLGCGYLGIRQGLQPDEPLTDSAYYRDYSLPRSLSEAVALFEDNPVAKELFGEKFVQIYSAVKRTEYEAFFQVISTWEREFLLLNV